MTQLWSTARPILWGVGALAYAASAHADLTADDVLKLSLEQLTNIEVTSVSKSAEKANEAAAAIFVITADDIRRMGATSIPEALRGAPGLNVAQAGSSQWAVTSRGFNGQFANKLLVLIDGRAVYTPLFNGVWWDAQDVMLEDIERIEVIRGPGATLWGANAVNGVINIITKNARDTQGGLASFAMGNQIHALTSLRQGMEVDKDAYVRVYAKYNNNYANQTLTGASAADSWKRYQAGFRSDWKQDEQSNFTLQGDIYTLDERLPWRLPTTASLTPTYSNQGKHPNGGNMLGRWNYAESPDSDITLQVYYDRAVRDNIAYDTTDTFDVDFQHVWKGLESHEITWGLGYRLIADDLESTLYYTVNPPTRTDSLFSAFMQDKVTLLPNEVFLTLGSKFERNAYSGFEFQPSARVSWLIDSNQTAWGAISRAVKTPYRNTSDGRLILASQNTGNGLYPIGFLGSAPNASLESEQVLAYEAGYRIQPLKTVSFDLATFYNQYDDLIQGRLGTPQVLNDPVLGNYLFIPITPYNLNAATSYGVELSANWEVTDNWLLTGNYNYLNLKLDKAPIAFSRAGTSPKNQFQIRSTLQLPHNIELNNALYFVDDLGGIGVPSYYRFDTRLAWKPLSGLELSLVGQNLLDPAHPEFSGFVYQAAQQVPRSVYGQVTFRY